MDQKTALVSIMTMVSSQRAVSLKIAKLRRQSPGFFHSMKTFATITIRI